MARERNSKHKEKEKEDDRGWQAAAVSAFATAAAGFIFLHLLPEEEQGFIFRLSPSVPSPVFMAHGQKELQLGGSGIIVFSRR